MDTASRYADTFELTRLGLRLDGQTPLRQFRRLTEGLPSQGDGLAEWSLRGEQDALGRRFLHLQVKAGLVLECQRCLAPFVWPLDTVNRLEVVATAAGLDEGESANEGDDFVERIVGSHRLDVLELVEDELILGVPYVPRHDTCPAAPQPLGHEDPPDAGQDGPSPFAVLGRLKKN